MKADIAALLYLVSGVLFILALKGLSSPATSQAGNRNGMIGMALAIATTLWVANVADGTTIGLIVLGLAVGGGIGAIMAKRIAMTQMPQLVAAFHSLVGLAAVLTAAAAFYSPEAFGIGAAGAIRTQSPGGNEPGRRHRYHHLCRFADRLRQAQWQHEGRADHVARAPSAQPGAVRRHHRPDRLFRDGAAGLDLLGHHRPGLRLRHHPHHSHRRRRHAGGGVDAELLFGLGGGGHRLHPGKHRPDHHRRAGRFFGRDPVLHHVQGHEPQLRQRHHGRLWRRQLRRRGRRRQGSSARSSRARPTMPPSS